MEAKEFEKQYLENTKEYINKLRWKSKSINGISDYESAKMCEIASTLVEMCESKSDADTESKLHKHFVRNCNTQEIIFELSTTTPYTCDDIVNFLILTDLEINKAKTIISSLCNAGVSSLTEVHTMIKLGYCCF